MQRLKCEIRTRQSGDESMLYFLAEECLHPLAEGAGHAELFRPDELLDLLSSRGVRRRIPRRSGRLRGRRA